MSLKKQFLEAWKGDFFASEATVEEDIADWWTQKISSITEDILSNIDAVSLVEITMKDGSKTHSWWHR